MNLKIQFLVGKRRKLKKNVNISLHFSKKKPKWQISKRVHVLIIYPVDATLYRSQDPVHMYYIMKYTHKLSKVGRYN